MGRPRTDNEAQLPHRARSDKAFEAGQEIGTVHARTENDADSCRRAIGDAMTLVDGPVEPPPLVYGWHG